MLNSFSLYSLFYWSLSFVIFAEMNIATYLEHSFLEPTTTIAAVEKLCAEALENTFASVCVPPMFVKKAKALCAGSTVQIATVVGFPFGYSAVEAKLAEVLLALVDGADELQIVINTAALKNNDWQYLANELNSLLPVIKGKQKLIQIIVETSLLTNDEMVKCCDLYGIAGVDFIKTATGFMGEGETVEAVKLIRKHLADAVKINAGGNVKSFLFAKELIDAGADRIGSSNAMSILAESKR